MARDEERVEAVHLAADAPLLMVAGVLVERRPWRRGVQRVEHKVDVRRAVLLNHGFENVEILAQNPDRTVREADRAGAGASGRHNEDALRKDLDAHVVRPAPLPQ